MNNGVDVLLIGFDSAEPTLLDKLCEAGRLPNLESLRGDHVTGAVTPPPGLGNDAIWRSLATCVSPATSGHYFVRPFDPVSYRCTTRPPPDDAPRPFWEHISDRGGRVAIIDVPLAPLPERLNGIVVAQWLANSASGRAWLGRAAPGGQVSGLLPLTYPAELAEEIAARYGIDTIGQRDRHAFDARHYARFRDDLIDAVDRKARLCTDRLERERWSLMMVVFTEGHEAGHSMWHLHDSGHRRHEREWVARHGDPVEDVYVAIDAAIGRLLRHCSDETTVCVLTETGMTTDNSANFLFDEVLLRLEHGAAPPRTGMETLRSAWRVLPSGVRTRFRDRFTNRVNETVDAMSVGARRSRKFFALDHNEVSGAIRINVIGREADGRVSPGRELEETCAELERDLLELRNIDTGGPVVSEVIRSAEVYKGKYADTMPDLFVIWNRDHPVDGVISPKFGEFRRVYPGMRTGDHVPLGRFYARGPATRRLRRNTPVAVHDFGPTVASILGIELPQPVDGAPVPELVRRS